MLLLLLLVLAALTNQSRRFSFRFFLMAAGNTCIQQPARYQRTETEMLLLLSSHLSALQKPQAAGRAAS